MSEYAGMSYIVMTSKHHGGFCMFDTETTNYNVVEQTPYAQDPLKLLSEACARHGLKFRICFSLVNWHQGHNFDQDNIIRYMEPIIVQQLHELMSQYGHIAEICFDMGNPTPSQSEKFKRNILDHQPEAVVNSRVWNNCGDFRTLADNQIIPSYSLENTLMK